MPKVSDLMKRGGGPSTNQLNDPDFVCAQLPAWKVYARSVGLTIGTLAAAMLGDLAAPTLRDRCAAAIAEYGPDAAMPIISAHAPKLAVQLGPDLALMRFDALGNITRPERRATRCREGCVCVPHDAPIEEESRDA